MLQSLWLQGLVVPQPQWLVRLPIRCLWGRWHLWWHSWVVTAACTSTCLSAFSRSRLSEVVLHGESNTGQASPRTPTQRMFQPQEAVQPKQNQTIRQPDTPAQKAKYS